MLQSQEVFPSESYFREQCARACAAFSPVPTLKHIHAVGCYHADFGGTDVDSKRLTKGLLYLAQSGFLIDPDYTVDTVNFLNERDYLAESDKADLVFISYILAQKPMGRAFVGHEYAPHRMSSLREALASSAEDPTTLLDERLGGMFSNDHSAAKWQERLLRAQAKVVYTHGGSHEIGTSMFEGAFQTLIATPQADKQGTYDCRTAEDLYGAGTDIPAWSGFAVQAAYLKECAPSITTAKTVLARRGHQVLKVQDFRNPRPSLAPPMP